MRTSRSSVVMPLPARHALRKLGRDIRDARRRRRIPAAIAAQRASISRTTLVKIEKGDPGVAIGIYATVLFVLGMADRLGDLAAPKNDPVGLQLEEENLPQRIRVARNPKRTKDKTWLGNPARFSLEPALQVGPGPFHTPADTPMFGAIGDSAPDRWGRALMRRMERRRAEREGAAPRSLQEIDFLLLVDDEARQGALRFAEKEGGPFLREEGVKRIPPLIELPKLLAAAEHVMEEKDTEEELRMLFAPGSSLGGARPKASVREKDGHLAIAKFPRKDDEINTVVWEAVALSLAQKSGIPVPQSRVETIAGKPVLLLRRFDRDGERRIPF